MLQEDYKMQKLQKMVIEKIKARRQLPIESVEDKPFGAYIKYLRKIHSIKQYEVAFHCNLTASRLSEYENGKRLPNVVTYEKIVKALRLNRVTHLETQELEKKYLQAVDKGSNSQLGAIYKIIQFDPKQ